MASTTRTPLLISAGAGLVHAAASLHWALGGTLLLGTVGSVRGGVESTGAAALLLVVVGLAKAALALAPVRLLGRPVPAVRGLLWMLGGMLAMYGAVLTTGGLVAFTGVLGRVADPDALAGHALLWDPLFLVWGAGLCVALRRTRVSPPARGGIASTSPRSVDASMPAAAVRRPQSAASRAEAGAAA